MNTVKYDMGMIGLGVMGTNFLLNLAEKGFAVAGYDKDAEKVKALEAAAGKLNVKGFNMLEEMVASLSSPKKVMLLVPAGKIVDDVISELIPLLNRDDIIIDGGNSHFTDTEIREKQLAEKNIFLLGTGISGGEEGARYGPSIMPGGNKNAFEKISVLFEKAAAKVNNEPCMQYMGPHGAGHYVKMVHNGIEYALMQLISEAYHFLKNVLHLSNEQLQAVFLKWNNQKLNSFLIAITADIFAFKENNNTVFLIDEIKDSASAKGTGKWTSQNAMDLDIPLPNIDAAVWMRNLSWLNELRSALSSSYYTEYKNAVADSNTIDKMQNALYVCFIISYAQGMSLLADASQKYTYNLNLSSIAKIWRGGCIIRSALLETFMEAFNKSPQLQSLLLDENIKKEIFENINDLRFVITKSIASGIPVPGFCAALSYLDAFASPKLPANLIQAQRDYFGSHTYERVDAKGTFHTNWSLKK